jgi:outer membrane protein
MKPRSILFGALVVLLLASATAQQRLTLTIDQAIEIGLENSRTLHTAEFKNMAAEAKASETNTLALPSLKFNGLYTRLSSVPPQAVIMPANSFGRGFPPSDISLTLSPTILNNYTLRATLQQPLFTGSKLSGAIQAAAFGAEATGHDYRKERADVIYNIKAAYWTLLRATEFKSFVDENIMQIESHVNDAQNLMQQGLMTTNDVMKVQVQLSEARIRRIDAENGLKLAMYAFNNTVGLPLGTEIGLASKIQIRDQEWGNIDQLVGNALERRPEVLGMSARVKAGEAGLTSARGGWWPQLYLVGNYNYLRPNQRFFPLQDEFKGTWDVSLSVSLDIWNWWQTGYQTSQAQAQLAQAKEGLSMTKDGVMLEVTQSYLAIQKARERKIVSEQEVAQAEENYRVMNAKYKQGLTANSDLLDAEVALLQAKLNLTQSMVDYELAIAQLSKAVGEEI